ncbi:protein of unknown function [Filimonas lacunae]|uniref:Zinc-dependent metalloprotease n=1 Tax=Filimonas lacunae TaxID=477680 RepID=A0A173MD27_9BACT|nr:zinc-dependent metalloprotease [Filimonas lacunae]BAV05379.1 hypothetical protein FLA_1386 [Filimonas lacunae]SIT21610.1 protein of unknown function [Filimonas lacunae]
MIRKKWLLITALLSVPVFVQAQGEKAMPAVKDFVKAGSKAYKGMFNVYVQDGKYFVEVPDRLMERDILTSITIIRGSAQRKRNPNMRFGFAGDAVNDRVIRFRKAAGHRLEITTPVFTQATDSSNIYYKILKAGLLPAYLSFPVKAATDTSSLIDLTELLEADSDLLSLKGAKDELKLGSYEPEKSKVLGVSCFEGNIVFRTLKSYAEAPATSGDAPPGQPPAEKPVNNPTMWEVGASWFLLPEKPMRARLSDARVGYFATVLYNYDKNPQQVELAAIANRWRLEPKPEDVQKYLRGELVEPVKPIVFYVDRNMPAYLIPYVISGVNAWQRSFEKVGFKNAIIGKLAPTRAEDSLFSMEDARYSFISYKPSEMANAYGPEVVDPRSGEILSSHIAVFHNVLNLLQRWYFSMCAAVDTGAHNVPMQQDVIGKMMKNVITHEVGHTIGLRHDFAGSSTYSIDSIRKPEYVRAHGFGPSVMDYMRFNYVAQPEDGMQQDDLFPGVGVYDDFAIEWGYRYLPEYASTNAEAAYLKQWVSGKRKDPRMFYMDEGNLYDPRVQSEDVGDNSMKASRLGIQNLKRTMANLESWVNDKEQDYTQLRSMHRAVEGRYYNYMQHVMRNIGGAFNDQALRSENRLNFVAVGRAQQKEAVAYLKEFLLKEQPWLYPVGLKAKTGFDFYTDIAGPYEDLIGRLFSRYYFIDFNKKETGDSSYTTHEFFNELYAAIYGKVKDGKPVSEFDRFVQGAFVNSVLRHANNIAVPFDVSVQINQLLDAIAATTRAAAATNKHMLTAAHYRAIADLITIFKQGSREGMLK